MNVQAVARAPDLKMAVCWSSPVLFGSHTCRKCESRPSRPETSSPATTAYQLRGLSRIVTFVPVLPDTIASNFIVAAENICHYNCTNEGNVSPVSSHLPTESIKTSRTGQERDIVKMAQALKAFESLVLDRLHRCLRENPDVFLHYDAKMRTLVPYCWQVNLNLTHLHIKPDLHSRPPQAS